MTPMTRREFVKGATLVPLALTSLPTMGQQTPRAASLAPIAMD